VKQRISNAYGRIPISFEKNEGQTDQRVEFLSRRPGYTLFLSAGGEAVLALSGSASAHVDALHSFRSAKVRPTHATPADIPSNGRTGAALIVTPVGANKEAHAVGQEALPGTVNYFRGSDPAKWRANLSTYARVGYENVYPGVDLVYYGNERQLEYDFIVHPGADPGIIALDFQGADELSVDPQGDLVVKIAGREVHQRRPLIYQEDGSARHEIAGRYSLTGKRTVGFQLSAYDATKTLVIDPVLVYSTYVGGAGVDIANDIAVDAAGSAYVTGSTEFGFPTTPGAYDVSSDGTDVVVMKLNSAGTDLVYSTYIGGGNTDIGYGIAVDAAGNAYVTGFTGSSPYASQMQFPTTAGAYDTSFNDVYSPFHNVGDVFVTKLNSTGTALVYSTYIGGSGGEWGTSIAVDAAGNAFVTGMTESTDFPTPAGAFDTSFNSLPASGDFSYDLFVTKLNATGTNLLYSTYLGGSGDEQLSGDIQAAHIAVDLAGNAYVTGETASSDFPTTAGAFDTTFSGGDVFVTKLNVTGNALVYSTFLGGGEGNGIAVDAVGNSFVTGTTGPDFPTTAGAFDTSWNDGGDVFVTKLNSTGTALIYSTYLGSGGDDTSSGIALDAAGNAYVTGQVAGFDFGLPFPTTPGAYDTSLNGDADIFITKLSATGAILVYSTYLGGTFNDFVHDIAVDAAGNAYVTGFTESTDFPTSLGAYDPFSNGNVDVFVTKLLLPAPPNTSPMITAAVGITREQDAVALKTSIASVSDTEDAENFLTVTVDGSTSSTNHGVTVSSIAIDSAGDVTAVVGADCGATGAGFTLRVTDRGNLFAEAALNVAVTSETTLPRISSIADVVATLPVGATSMPVTFPLPTATDNCSTPTVVTNPVSGALFNVGTTTVNVTATDGVGNTATKSFTVTVLTAVRYNFTGFFQPVDNPPTFNTANAGRAIPVKFSLSGPKGLDIFAAGSPSSAQVDCPSASGATIEETVAASGSFLQYDSGADQYNYVWKTDASWSGTCRQLTIKLNDGTTYTANFQFR
jgi:hypothetical protein